jgi:hypothetical protein
MKGAIHQMSKVNCLIFILIQVQRRQCLFAVLRFPNDLSSQVHPIPSFDNLTAFDLMVDKMEELGLWLMYDMRQ